MYDLNVRYQPSYDYEWPSALISYYSYIIVCIEERKSNVLETSNNFDE